MANLQNKPEIFQAGNISSHFDNWTKITSDKFLLDIVKNGYSIEFDSDPLSCRQTHSCMPKQQQNIINNEIEKLSRLGVLCETSVEQGQFLSGIFTVPNNDGTHRLILNLSELNQSIEKIATRITIRKFAQLIGKCVASEPGVQFAPLYYKSLETERDVALKQ